MIDNSIEKAFFKYREALNYLLGKFNALADYYEIYTKDNPIEYVKGRIKKIDSIEEKIKIRKRFPGIDESQSIINYLDKLHDIVGVRIVCSYLSDMEEIIKFIKLDPTIKVLNEKDYVTSAKDSGYRSYHMIVEISVNIGLERVPVVAEIQIRTLVMDMQASLDHKNSYKKEKTLPENTKNTLHIFNNFCFGMDHSLDKMITRLKGESIPENKVPYMNLSEKDYQNFIFKYERALNIMQSKLETIKGDFEKKGIINPIEHIKGRIKEKDKMLLKMQSISEKKEFQMNELEDKIHDIAGIRIVCSFLSDLPQIIDILKNDKELIFVEEKENDYITNPKPNGYRGYHLLVLVPVNLSTGITWVKVEIILQTIAMAVWASAEHKLCYKKKENPEFQATLKFISDELLQADKIMNTIYLDSRSKTTLLALPDYTHNTKKKVLTKKDEPIEIKI